MKFLHCIFLTCLTLTKINSMAVDEVENNETEENETEENSIDNSNEPLIHDGRFLVYYIMTFILTLFQLSLEIVQIILKKLKWIELHNILQMTQIVLIFTFQVSLFFDWSENKDVLNCISATIVFVAWMDFSFELKSLMFGKYPNVGLYIRMLTEVRSRVYVKELNVVSNFNTFIPFTNLNFSPS